MDALCLQTIRVSNQRNRCTSKHRSHRLLTATSEPSEQPQVTPTVDTASAGSQTLQVNTQSIVTFAGSKAYYGSIAQATFVADEAQQP